MKTTTGTLVVVVEAGAEQVPMLGPESNSLLRELQRRTRSYETIAESRDFDDILAAVAACQAAGVGGHIDAPGVFSGTAHPFTVSTPPAELKETWVSRLR